MSVREVAASAAGDDDLAPDMRIALDDEHLASATAGIDRTKKSGRPATDHHNVET